jgi:hypothetical protein
MALKYDLQLTVKKADGSTLALKNSGGAKDTFAEAKEAIRAKLQVDADAATASAADLTEALGQLS